MKKLIIFTISLVLLDAANAQSLLQKVEGTATIPEKESNIDRNLKLHMDSIKAETTKAPHNWIVCSKTDSEKIKEFDETLQKFRALFDLVSEESELGELMNQCYNLSNEHLENFKNKSTDKSLTQSQREFYKKQIPMYESAVEKINAKKIEIQKVRNEISTAKKELEGAKLEFIDALSVDDLEWQNKCLEKLKSSRELFYKIISWLHSIDDRPNPSRPSF
jgi:hypothetical protein